MFLIAPLLNPKMKKCVKFRHKGLSIVPVIYGQFSEKLVKKNPGRITETILNEKTFEEFEEIPNILKTALEIFLKESEQEYLKKS